MYAITAITGRVGGAVARTLLDRGYPVRAIVRERAKGEPWAARGCEIAVADLSDAGRLAEALRGAAGAFILLPPISDPSPGFPEAKAHIAVIKEALLQAKPTKVVVLSTIGAEVMRPNLTNGLRLLEEALAEMTFPISFLRGAWFMENAEWHIASARDDGVIRSFIQPLDRPIPMIATDDLGRVAAELLLEDWIGHRVIEIEAAARVTPESVAAAFAKALGRPVRAEVIPREDWEATLRSQGIRNPIPTMQTMDGFNLGWIEFGVPGALARRGSIDIESVVGALIVAHLAANPQN